MAQEGSISIEQTFGPLNSHDVSLLYIVASEISRAVTEKARIDAKNKDK
jgi:hypothetical protein